MKHLLFALLLSMSVVSSIIAQDGVSIGRSAPDSSAILHVHSPENDKGMLIPRLTTVQRNNIETNATPADGLIIYNTDQEAFNYYDGSDWVRLIPTPAKFDLDMGGNRIFNLLNGTRADHAVNKGQLDVVESNNLNRSGTEAMTGDLNVGNNKIVNLGEGANDGDAVNMSQLNVLSDALLDRPTTLTLSSFVDVISDNVKFLQLGNLGVIIGVISFNLTEDIRRISFTIEDDIPGFGSVIIRNPNIIQSFVSMETPSGDMELGQVKGSRPLVIGGGIGDRRLTFTRDFSDLRFDVGEWRLEFQITYFTTAF